jgi:oligopeptide transport system substrate-binding protein
MFVFNETDELLQNEKVRLAFSLALDREQIIQDLYNGLGVPAYGLIPDACGVAETNFRETVEEPLLAYSDTDPKELLQEGLTELGLSDDPSQITVTVSFGGTSATSKTFGEYYQQLWQNALGINVELEFNDSTTHFANSKSGDYQIAQVSWGANFEPQFQLTRWVGGGQAQVGNDEYDAIVSEAVTTLDDSARLGLYADAEKVLIDTAVIAPIYYVEKALFAYSYVQGLSENTFDTTGMKNIYVRGR